MTKLKEPCPKDCKGRIVNAKSGKYCECIEAKLREPKRTCVSARGVGQHINEFAPYIGEAAEDSWFREEKAEKSKEEVTAHLKLYGLADFEIEVIWLRFYEEMKFRDIVKELGWTSTGAAAHYYKQALAKLRKRGFTFETE